MCEWSYLSVVSYTSHTKIMLPPGVVAESVEQGLRVWEIGSLVPQRIKPMSYKIDTCHFLILVHRINKIEQGLVNSVPG